MAAVLLVHDDIATIAAVRRLLTRAGHEVVLATSTGDALTAFDHQQPALVILAPAVEAGQGAELLKELARHPGGATARVLLVGEGVEGSAAPVVPLPLDGATFLEHVEAVLNAPPPEPAAVAPAQPGGSLADTLFGDLPPELTAALEQTQQEVEAETIASLESSLVVPTRQNEDELAQLEAEVREEAARRRRARLEHAAAAAEAVDEPAEEVEAAEDARPPEITQVVSMDAFAPEHEDDSPRSREDLAALIRAQEAEAERVRQALEESESPAAIAERQRREAVQRARREADEARQRLAALRAERERDGANIPLESDELFRRKEAERAAREARLKDRLGVREPTADGRDDELDFGEMEPGSAIIADATDAANSLEEPPRVAAIETDDPFGLDEMVAAGGSADVGEGRAGIESPAEGDTAAASRRAAGPARDDASAAGRTQRRTSRRSAAGVTEEEPGATAVEDRASSRRAATPALEEEPGATAFEGRAPSRGAARRAPGPALDVAEAQDEGAVDDGTPHDLELGTVRRSRAASTGDAGAEEASLTELRDGAEQQAQQHGRERAASERALQQADARLEALSERERLALEAADRARKMAAAASQDAQREAKRLQAAEQADRASRARDKAETERLARQLEAETRGHEERTRELEAVAEEERRERERLAHELETTRSAAAEAAARAAEAARQAAADAAAPPVAALPEGELPPEQLPRSGIAPVEKLAEVVRQIAAARIDARLELKTEDALRVLWLRGGVLTGALSTVPGESLLHRARLDGLIDARQANELSRAFGDRSPAEQLEALREHGYIRDAEAIPLVQRHTEAIALEAMSAGGALYRVTQQTPTPDVLLAASTRPVIGLLAEALRRALEPEPFLESYGGLRAIPVRRQLLPPPDRVDLPERERRMLEGIDGESTIERLVLASGVRQDHALRALVVAKAMGWIDFLPAPEAATGREAPELELRRLESKLAEVREADYFSVLGLPRSAGRDEVIRAFELLSGEFNPLKYAAYPDPVVHQQAEQVHSALEEAALALRDDHLRSEYARNLAD